VTYTEENGNKAIWFVAGVAIGATIALLYAPSSGRVTRRRISRAAARGKESLVDSSQGLMDRGKELYERGRKMADEAAEYFDRGKKMVEG
jgi:gas vesicle protein